MGRFIGVRHGPFDIQGGGAWVFGPGQDIFSDKIRARLFFLRHFGPDYFFFITKSLNICFRDYFMLNSGFRDNFMLSRQPHTQI